MDLNEKYWTNRYSEGQTGWDAGSVTTPLKTYFDQLTDKDMRILIPGCGNAHEAEYLFHHGFANVFLADISNVPLDDFSRRVVGFPEDHLLHMDFFELESEFDLIIEQTFFCALDPAMRIAYAGKVNQLLKSNGKLVGVLFDDPLNTDHPPFGGNKEEYKQLFGQYFNFNVFEACYNSIEPRKGRELFINLTPKSELSKE